VGDLSFSRGLFGKPKSPDSYRKGAEGLSLWDKKDARIVTLSGGMKRRVMIAKALSHEPQILFSTSRPRAVDVELRKGIVGSSATLQPPASPSSSPRITSKRPRRWPTGIGVIHKGEIILVGG